MKLYNVRQSYVLVQRVLICKCLIMVVESSLNKYIFPELIKSKMNNSNLSLVTYNKKKYRKFHKTQGNELKFVLNSYIPLFLLKVPLC